MTKKTVEHGNTVQAQAVFDREVHKIGLRVLDVESFIHQGQLAKFVVRAIKFRAGNVPGAEWIAIITAYSPDGPVVAFHAGDGFKETLTGLSSRLKNGSLKWKVDEYA